jgi:hypothetical protein
LTGVSNAVEARTTPTGTQANLQTAQWAGQQPLTGSCVDTNAPEAAAGAHRDLDAKYALVMNELDALTDKRCEAIRLVNSNLGERDQMPLAVQIITPLLLGALSGATGGIAGVIASGILNQTLKTLIENVLKDSMGEGIKAAVEAGLRGGGESRHRFFHAQILGLIDSKRLIVRGMIAERTRLHQQLDATALDCRQDATNTMMRELDQACEALARSQPAASDIQYREGLAVYMTAQAQGRLGTTPASAQPREGEVGPPPPQPPTTDMARAVELNSGRIEGVINVELFSGAMPWESWTMEHFSRISRVECRGITQAARNDPAMQNTTIGQMRAPIVVRRGSYRFGRDEGSRYWADPDLRGLTRATGASTPEEGARMIIERFIADIPFSRIEIPWL